MKFISTSLPDAYVIDLDPIRDERGLFARTFCKEEFQQIGHTKEFVQFNHSVNNKKGTLRGMHFQIPPFSEVKLIRCISGKVYDVIIDLRAGSLGFLKWYGAELSKENMRMMYVPEGFAHGFLTLSGNAELLYHHTSYYTPSAEGGLRHDDPLIGIKWPDSIEVISEKDKAYPLLTESFSGLMVNNITQL
jgi:dTDP-4-dehydrorhamnose 3,5-epimerase